MTRAKSHAIYLTRFNHNQVNEGSKYLNTLRPFMAQKMIIYSLFNANLCVGLSNAWGNFGHISFSTVENNLPTLFCTARFIDWQWFTFVLQTPQLLSIIIYRQLIDNGISKPLTRLYIISITISFINCRFEVGIISSAMNMHFLVFKSFFHSRTENIM